MRRATSCCSLAILLSWTLANSATADDPNANPSLHVTEKSTPRASIAQGVVRRDEDGFRGLYTMNRDGTNVEYLGAAPGMISSAAPEWSHDGKYVAFDTCPQIDAVGQGKVFVLAVDGPFQGQVLDFGYGNTPSWSPDDRQIAYMLNSGNPIQARWGVWIMDADGTNRRWVADGFYPRWSPDGESLCCDGAESDRDTLTLIDMATRASRPLWKTVDWRLINYGGNWSPDGQRIVFVGRYQEKDRLATIDVNGGEDSIHVLYTNDDSTQKLVGPPAWSPDGQQIVFAMQPTQSGPREWWQSYLYSIAADVPSAPVLLEGKKVGNINRGMNWSRDSKKVIFSSER